LAKKKNRGEWSIQAHRIGLYRRAQIIRGIAQHGLGPSASHFNKMPPATRASALRRVFIFFIFPSDCFSHFWFPFSSILGNALKNYTWKKIN
jgi:hypothetical protein